MSAIQALLDRQHDHRVCCGCCYCSYGLYPMRAGLAEMSR